MQKQPNTPTNNNHLASLVDDYVTEQPSPNSNELLILTFPK